MAWCCRKAPKCMQQKQRQQRKHRCWHTFTWSCMWKTSGCVCVYVWLCLWIEVSSVLPSCRSWLALAMLHVILQLLFAFVNFLFFACFFLGRRKFMRPQINVHPCDKCVYVSFAYVCMSHLHMYVWQQCASGDKFCCNVKKSICCRYRCCSCQLLLQFGTFGKYKNF